MSIAESLVHEIFQDFGLFVRQSQVYGSGVPALIDAESVKKRTQLDSGAERIRTLGAALARDSQNVQTVESLVSGEVQVLDDYVRNYVKDAIQAKGTSAQDILEDLADRMLFDCSPVQCVLRNEVAVDGSPAADPDNAGDGTLGSITLSQFIAAQRFTVECLDATTEGSEQWSVTGSVCGQLDTATTAVAYEDTTTLLQFTITAGSAAFAVGDKLYFYTTCTEQLFQTFFRDNFRLVFPSAAAGSETIEEAWAQ